LIAFTSRYSNIRDILHPTCEILAILREIRAAHVWWDNPEEKSEGFLGMLREKV
jgi:hypothetical protein